MRGLTSLLWHLPCCAPATATGSAFAHIRLLNIRAADAASDLSLRWNKPVHARTEQSSAAYDSGSNNDNCRNGEITTQQPGHTGCASFTTPPRPKLHVWANVHQRVRQHKHPLALGASMLQVDVGAPVLAAAGSSRQFWTEVLPENASKKLRHWLRLKTAAKPLKPGRISPMRHVPAHIPRPPYIGQKSKPAMSRLHQVQDAQGIVRARHANTLAAQALAYAGSLVAPGVTTDDIDAAVHEYITAHGAYPSPLGYGGFPKSVCTSVNEVACHGIPDDRPFEDGDIVSIDVSCYLDGYHGDNCRTFGVGELAPHLETLLQVSRQVVDEAVQLCGPGVPYSDIGNSISATAAKHGLGIVRHFVGHGLGQVFHSHPIIYPYANTYSGRMVEGETFTIEPILTLGLGLVREWDDGWTSVTLDRSIASQFEHAVLVTDSGVEVLTAYE